MAQRPWQRRSLRRLSTRVWLPRQLQRQICRYRRRSLRRRQIQPPALYRSAARCLRETNRVDLLDLEDGERAGMGHEGFVGQWTLPAAFDSETVSKPVWVLSRACACTRPKVEGEGEGRNGPLTNI